MVPSVADHLQVLRAVVDTGVPRGFHRRVGRHSVHYYFAPMRLPGGEIGGAVELVRLASATDRRLREASRDVLVRLGLLLATDVPVIHVDPGQLQQVLTNLVMNAVEATPADGRVSVVVTRQSRGERSGVGIAVSDTGTGILPETLRHVFVPFFTTKPRGQGTGLGLSISRDIVVGHGGEIWIDSEEKRGTTVRVWLPESPPP